MHSIRIIKPDDMTVYRRLERLADPPRRLFVRGQYDPGIPAVAVVGSRKHSAYGKFAAQMLAADLAKTGVTIISGLALGIDSLAHTVALDAGGSTVAIMPGGVDRVYPASHRSLAERMVASGGALISEYPSGTLPAKHHFVARNRIVAALSDALVVVEAAERSGTLITAEYALDIGLPVMAVPGPINSPTSVGTNRLIDMGAKLVASARDVVAELGLDISQTATAYQAPDAASQAVIDCLQQGPLGTEVLADRLNLEVPELNRILTRLELDSAIVSLGNNLWALKTDLPS